MDEIVSEEDACRDVYCLLRGVSEGKCYLVMSAGVPIARLVPVEQEAGDRERERGHLLTRLRDQPIVKIGPWSREELYDLD